MRLLDLDPRWISVAHGRNGQGVVFFCPKCGNHRVVVWFANPIDGQAPAPPFPNSKNNHRWQRQGDAFDTLTLTPSIQIVGTCSWHGFVKNGEITTV